MSTAKFDRLRAVGTERYNEKDDCAVIAVAIAAGVSYGKAHAVMERLGRTPKKGTPIDVIIGAMRRFGFMAKYEKYDTESTTTVNQWKKHVSTPEMVITRTHISTIIDGIVHDYVGNGSRRKVKGAIKLEPLVGPVQPEFGG